MRILKSLPIIIPGKTGKSKDISIEKKINAVVDKILTITKEADYLYKPAKQPQVKEYENKSTKWCMASTADRGGNPHCGGQGEIGCHTTPTTIAVPFG